MGNELATAKRLKADVSSAIIYLFFLKEIKKLYFEIYVFSYY